MVNAAYGDQALSHSNVFQWYGRFRDGQENIENDPRSGQSTECRNDNNVEKISQLLLQNHHLSLRMLADEVNFGKDTVRKIVVEDMQKWKICSHFVPQFLTPEQEDQRIAACRDLIATADSDPDFFKKIVTGDGTWCFTYDPTTKHQSAAWVGETSPRPKKLQFQKSHVKTLPVLKLSRCTVYDEVNNWWYGDSRQVDSGVYTRLFKSQPRHQLTLTEILYGLPQSLHGDARIVTQIRLLSVIPSTSFTVHYSFSKLPMASKLCAAHFIRVCTQGILNLFFIKANMY